MKRVITNKEKMKNTMYIVFGIFALALFAITRIHPSYANEGLMVDDALDAIVLYGEVEQLPEDEEVEEGEDIIELEEIVYDEIMIKEETDVVTNEENDEAENEEIPKIRDDELDDIIGKSGGEIEGNNSDLTDVEKINSFFEGGNIEIQGNQCEDGETYSSEIDGCYTSRDANNIVYYGNDGEIGTITIKDPDGTQIITIMDRNLGAMSDDINNVSSYGYYFQRGNNHPIENSTETVTPIAEKPEYKNYWPGHSWNGTDDHIIANNDYDYWSGFNYIGDTQIKHYDGLWGGYGDYWDTVENVGIWGGLKNGDLRQGPCPTGYHVPSAGERNALAVYYYNAKNPTATKKVVTTLNSSFSEPTFRVAFKLPLAGRRNSTTAKTQFIGQGFYLSSSPLSNNSNSMRRLRMSNTSDVNPSDSGYHGDGFSLRCFKDVEDAPSSSTALRVSFRLDLGERGGNLLGATDNDGVQELMQYVVSGRWVEQPVNPTIEGGKFLGRVEDTESSELFDFTQLISGSITLYAKYRDTEATLLSGTEFAKKINYLSEYRSYAPNYQNPNTSVKRIKRVNTLTQSVGSNNIISVSEDSDYPVYAWYSNEGGVGTIYYYSQAKKIYLNQDSKEMFFSFKGLEEFDFEDLDTSKVNNMRGMFRNCSNLTSVNLSKANLSNVTDMGYMFNSCTNLISIDFTGKSLHNVTKMDYMFQSSSVKTIDFSGINISNVVNMGGMFYSSKVENVNFSNAILGNIKDMHYMFYYATNLNSVNFSGVDLSSMDNMQQMFYNSSIKNVNFNNTILSGDMNGIFSMCNNLTGVDFSQTDLSNVTNMSNMFYNSKGIESINFSGKDLSSVTSMFAMFEYSNVRNVNFSTAILSNLTNVNNMFSYCRDIIGVDFSGADLHNLESAKEMFGDSDVRIVNFNNVILGNLKDISKMFYQCSYLESVNFDGTDVSSVTNMSQMFQNCGNLEELNLGSRDTSSLQNISSMFKYSSKLKTIYVSDKFVTTNVTNSGDMFLSVSSLVGGNGTAYSGNKIDGEYARIDTDAISGYFTNILDKPYIITYHTNEGILSGEKTTYTQRDSFTLPVPIRTGYIFLGWTGSNGLEPEILVNIAEFTVGDLEYTANWELGKYKIIFDTDGGNTIDSIEVDYNSLLTGMNLLTSTKECNDFSRWDVELPETMPAHDITLKAIWNYTCSRSSGGGGGAKKSESTTREIAINTPTEQEHNSANEEQKSEISSNPENTKKQEIGQEIVIDGGTQKTVAVKNTEIVATVRNTTHSSSSRFTKEQNDAYSFAKSNGITTTSSIEDAKMNTELTRIQMAKMLSNFAINVLGQEPDPEKGIVKFNDVTNKMDKQYDNAVTKAYQLGIMGQNMKNNEFRPSDTVTRAEFATALSRLLYQTEEGNYKGTGKYYIPHVAKLYNEGIINKTDPKIKEKRGYVMIMLMRTVK